MPPPVQFSCLVPSLVPRSGRGRRRWGVLASRLGDGPKEAFAEASVTGRARGCRSSAIGLFVLLGLAACGPSIGVDGALSVANLVLGLCASVRIVFAGRRVVGLFRASLWLVLILALGLLLGLTILVRGLAASSWRSPVAHFICNVQDLLECLAQLGGL